MFLRELQWNRSIPIASIALWICLGLITVRCEVIERESPTSCFTYNMFSFWIRGQSPKIMCVPELCREAPYQLRKEMGSILSDIHLAVVACGNESRMEDAMAMMKSALILSDQLIHFHVFADDDLRPKFRDRIAQWPASVLVRMTLTLHPITYPEGRETQWRNLFGPCATQRLFFPDLLTHNDLLLYVDTDILFLRPIEHLWMFFPRFNASHIAALAPEHEVDRIGWYNRHARHPFYGRRGVNSGVMLMKLARMRELNWVRRMLDYFTTYYPRIPWVDQDLLNIFFHDFPEKLLVFPCQWNFRQDHCMYGLNCQQAKTAGVSVLHGNRKVFHNDKQPVFRAIYNVFREFQFGQDLKYGLLRPMEKAVKAQPRSDECGAIGHLLTYQLARQLEIRDRGGSDVVNPYVLEDLEIEY